MFAKYLTLTFLFFLQCSTILGQRQWVLPTTTAAEMRNPYTWYWPYAIAASEAYRDYFVNAQKITNQLYQQSYATQAFPWASNTASGAVGQAENTANGVMGGQGGQGGQGGWNGPPGADGWTDQGGMGGFNG